MRSLLSPNLATAVALLARFPLACFSLFLGTTLAASSADPEFYEKTNELVVTRGQKEVTRLSCERIPLRREKGWPSQHIGGHMGRTRDGRLYAAFGSGSDVMLFESSDDGRRWTGKEVELSALGAFTVLADDTFLAATTGKRTILIHRSTDRGKAWKEIGQIPAGPFDAFNVDSNLFQLKNGTVLVAVDLRLNPGKGGPLLDGVYAQYIYRSIDRGQTWEGGADPRLWTALKEDRLSAADVALFKKHGFNLELRRNKRVPVDTGPEAYWPGTGGTFPGCFETGFRELANGTILAAFRYSGSPRAWHKDLARSWGANKEPDEHGRIFRHVVLGESADGGKSWKNLRPVVDADKRPFLESGECNGEILEMKDGRLVLIHQKRYPRNASELVARVSTDGGRTWQSDRYRINFGFGYSSSLLLGDGTIVTATGSSDSGGGQPRGATAVRWRLAAK